MPFTVWHQHQSNIVSTSTMNTVQAALKQEIDKEVAAHEGLRGYQAHVLQNLELRTVVRESHATPIIQLAYNNTQPQLRNLVATVGADQATIYDDLHMGDHVGVVAHFTNTRTEHHKGGVLRALAWVACQGLTTHTEGDCWLAVAGCDHVIQVLSVVESRVVRQLSGHTCQVVDLSGAAAAPGVLLSMSEGGTVRVWDVPRASCLVCIQTDAYTAELHPSGGYFLTGSRTGQVQGWDLSHVACQYPASSKQQAVLNDETNTHHQVGTGSGAGPQGKQVAGAGQQAPVLLTSQVCAHNQAVDCIRFVPGDNVLVKTCGGALTMWHMPHLPTSSSSMPSVSLADTAFQLQWQALIPDAVTPAVYPSRCLLAACADGAYVCCGNNVGTVFVLDSARGEVVQQVAAEKVQEPVRSCGLSDDCRHLWAVLGNGFIFRFEYVRPEDRLREDSPDLAESCDAAGPQGAAAQEDGPQPQAGAGSVPASLKRPRDSSPELEAGC